DFADIVNLFDAFVEISWHLTGYGTPKEWASARYLFVLLLTEGDALFLGVGLAGCGEISALFVISLHQPASD
ncbi:MAG: hypothetical protein HQL98_11300, partial [Magnetococcales bacterium]|nr:hypothetical protein [Magnetococcales bacterium]